MDRKTYYISVQAGQILEDQQAAAYELEASLSDNELNHLRSLFETISVTAESEMFHFASSPYGRASDSEINSGYDATLKQIYQLIHERGTESTRRTIEAMGLF